MSSSAVEQDRCGAAVIVGCGYTGLRLASALLPKTRRLIAITHTSRINMQGVESLQVNLDNTQTAQVSAGDDACVFYFVPPPSAGHTDIHVRTFVESVLTDIPKRFILISTTGVYGDCQGNWIDENTPVNPQTDRASRRLDSERFVEQWAARNNVSLAILRVAAIYGPGRVPVDRIRSGLTLPPASESGYLNRIHVDDLTTVCVAASESNFNGVFNVSDGYPLRMIEYMNLVARIWGLPQVRESSDTAILAQHSSSMRQYLRESRKIDNHRMLRELSLSLRYPNPELGLEACFREEQEKNNHC